MSRNIVLRAYERSLPYNVPLRVDPEESDQIIKIQEKLEQLEKSCAEATTHFKKRYAEIHNKEKNEEVDDYDEADIDQDENSDEDNLEEEKEEDEQYHTKEDVEKNIYDDEIRTRESNMDETTNQSGYVTTEIGRASCRERVSSPV